MAQAAPNITEQLATMAARLQETVPEVELRYKAELVEEILQLKCERHAVILGHNYMEPALFATVPDVRGDSLELARRAAESDAERIVFCGVRFMAETAKILNPSRKVLLPSAKGGCSLAASITADDVRRLRERYPGVPVVSYVNTYAEVKALSDVCCTSSNAAAVVRGLEADQVIFIPDMYLAQNVARETGKRLVVPSRDLRHGDVTSGTEMIGWPGACEVHEKFTVADIERVREQHPDAVILAHPECSAEVCAAADFSGSTSAMIRYVEASAAPHYLLLTECSMADNIAAANPDRDMLRLCSVRCPHMNEITLEETRDALLYDRYQIEVPEDVAVAARSALERMLEVG